MHSANRFAEDGGLDEDLEDRFGRSHFLGVGPGIELPTQMHYFEEETIDNESVHEAPAGGVRRVSVMNFGYFQVRDTLADRCSSEISKLEERPFDYLPLYNSCRSRNGCNPRRTSHMNEYRATDSFERRHGQASVFPNKNITSEQVAALFKPNLVYSISYSSTSWDYFAQAVSRY